MIGVLYLPVVLAFLFEKKMFLTYFCFSKKNAKTNGKIKKPYHKKKNPIIVLDLTVRTNVVYLNKRKTKNPNGSKE